MIFLQPKATTATAKTAPPAIARFAITEAVSTAVGDSAGIIISLCLFLVDLHCEEYDLIAKATYYFISKIPCSS